MCEILQIFKTRKYSVFRDLGNLHWNLRLLDKISPSVNCTETTVECGQSLTERADSKSEYDDEDTA